MEEEYPPMVMFQAPVIQGRVRGLAGVPLLPQPQLEAAARPPGGHQGPRLAIEVTRVMMVLLMIVMMIVMMIIMMMPF